jgi:chaperone modulatory protein CbpM
VKIEVTEVTWLDEQFEYSLEDLAERSHLSREDLQWLIDSGAIPSLDARALKAARTAARLRADFETDLHGVALAMTLLRRISDLELELSGLRARVPDLGN